MLGALEIGVAPEVLRAINPTHAVRFLADNGFTGFFALGSVFLVVTGGEALFADMGHFGRFPITLSWYGIVLPGLVLNYFGQGALLLTEPEAIDNPFYRLAPEWATIPLVVLATGATVIASQALISGAFSLTHQAAQLGYLPRLRIIHTSAEERGQVYVPAVNWILMVACVAMVIGFRSSTNLAAAYGVAVTMTMAITTVISTRSPGTVSDGHGYRPQRFAACSSWSTSRSSGPTSPRSPTAAGSRWSSAGSSSPCSPPGEPDADSSSPGSARAVCPSRSSPRRSLPTPSREFPARRCTCSASKASRRPH